jgi:RecA-family ATPase
LGWFHLLHPAESGEVIRFSYDRINEYVSLLDELHAEGTETALRPDCETLSAFLRRPKEQPYLVDGILAAGQLAVIGGPEKGMKTNVTVDLAISLAGGEKFLGHFRVPRPAKVLLVTGETCEKPLENLCRRILAARGLPNELDNL